jgi:hypothetical protein
MHHDHSDHHHDDAKQHSHGEPYTAEEIEHFHSQDIHAARAIVTLMTAVFCLGLVGSLTIAIIVAG